MHWTKKGIFWSFHLLLFIVPLIFLPNTSELFEFNKIIVTYILSIFILFFWFSRMAIEGRVIFKKTLLDFPILFFLISQIVSLIFSIDIRTSWLGYYSRFNGGLASLLCYALLYWSAVSNLKPADVKSLITTSLISSLLVSIWGFLERLGIDSSWWVQDVQTRVFSTLGQPNWLAAYLSTLIFIPIAEYLISKKLSSLLYFIFLFLVLLFTRSRSGLLAFGLVSIIFWGIYYWKSGLKYFSIFIYWVIIIVAGLIIVPNPLKDQFIKNTQTTKPVSGTSLETGGTESGNIRKIVWSGALKIWQGNTKNFWIGTGPETFAMSYYQFRPIEHNQTSEWELLYNKAHNEFLNYLSTTGLFGLGSYLILLAFMLVSLFQSLTDNQNSISSTQTTKIALLCGWFTISITNFWGFSVVIIQIFLFLFPAFVTILNYSDNSPTSIPIRNRPILIIFLMLLAGFWQIKIINYWLADTYYAAGDTAYQSFAATNEPLYIYSAYKSYSLAHDASPKEPVIISQLAFASAYMALLTSENDSTTSAKMAEYANSLANLAISYNPHHPNLYKTASKTMIVLSVTDQNYLLQADRYLNQAQKISPTDPRLPYNRGIIYKQLNQSNQAKSFFQMSLQLKPDFADPAVALKDL